MRSCTLLALFLLGACHRRSEPVTSADPPPPENPQPSALPAGHPPLGERPARPGPKGPVTVAGVTLTPPETWRSIAPTSAMRKAQYVVPGEAGEAEAVVFYFGVGQGGSVDDNVARWFGQFAAPGGGPATHTSRDAREVGGLRVTVARAEGTYSAGMGITGPADPKPGWAMIGVIIEAREGNVFLKVTGPRETVRAADVGVAQLVASIRRAAGERR